MIIIFIGSPQSWNRFVLQQLHSETLEEKVDSCPEKYEEKVLQGTDNGNEEKGTSKKRFTIWRFE